MAPSELPAHQASDPARDRALARDLALGSPDAMRAVYERCAGRAFALVLRLTHSRADAEEVLQETFLEVWRRAREFDPARGGLETWVATMARTRAIDRLRSLGAQARAAEGVAREPPPVSAVPPEPSEAAARREERGRVDAALRTLPPEQREVLELAYFEGLSQQEVAARTGAPLGTVKTRTRLALEKLAGLLRDLDAPEAP
ncbi:sigma-70 family RNA polymerase sigma factor [Myxococcaceae bacterium GXIMD 01537]